VTVFSSTKSATEKALEYVRAAPRIRLQDLRDNAGARTSGAQVTKAHNQAGHTRGELQRAAKPPLGWLWGDFYRPWHRMFPGERHFNGDINLRREYIPLSLLELQRMIDLGWLDTTKLIDICALCSTKLVHINPERRQFGIHLTDEGSEIFSADINLEVQWASLTAIAAVEKAGGRIRNSYYDLESLKAATDAERWFLSGRAIPRRKQPPHSLMRYYADPNYRGYLSDETSIAQSRHRLAEILKYTIRPSFDAERESKDPSQVFLGIEAGSLVSLTDKAVFEPTNSTLLDFYRGEAVSDTVR